MSAKKVVVTTTCLTAEEIEKRLRAKGGFRVGTNTNPDGSRRLIKGQTDRQPMLRGSQAGKFS